MMMEVVPARSPFEPTGYCPKCDYHTDAGLCPECGYDIKPQRLRSRPRSRTAKHIRRVLLAIILGYGIIWFASQQAKLAPYFPTAYLLAIQTGQGPLASTAQAELANRLASNRLSARQVERFVRQWADVRWFVTHLFDADTGSARVDQILVLGNRFFDRSFPATASLLMFSFEERVGRLTVDGRRFGPNELPELSDPSARGMLGGPSRADLTRSQGFYSTTYLLSTHADRDWSPSENVIDETKPLPINCDTTVVVTDLAANRVLASWPMSHSVDWVPRVKSTTRVQRTRQPRDEPYPQGIEDLMFPYGRIPGGFSRPEMIEEVPRPRPVNPN